ncbi:MAG: dTMP kinase [Gemmatimonadales bacterium]|nr:MAG: dTMP kinase [Gemmatimonadales bacterium]
MGEGSGPGCFLVLEGVEGAGKSTQLPALAAWLEERGHVVVTGREPGGTRLGESVRSLLLDQEGPPVCDESELLLMLAARAAFVREVVGPALARGAVVVADRFDLSTLAYQGFGRGLGAERISPMIEFATGGLRPHRTLVLDLPVEEGLARQGLSGRGPDRIEAEGRAFLERVAEGYRSLVRQDPRAVSIDARGTVSQVQERIRAAIQGLLPEPPGSGGGSTPAGDSSGSTVPPPASNV